MRVQYSMQVLPYLLVYSALTCNILHISGLWSLKIVIISKAKAYTSTQYSRTLINKSQLYFFALQQPVSLHSEITCAFESR